MSTPLLRVVADENIPLVQEALAGIAEVTLLPGRKMTRWDLANADALLVRSVTKVDGDLLDGTPVRFVGTATIGTDHIDEAFLARQGIGFSSAAGSNARSVAEYVVAALLELAVRHHEHLRGTTLGIIGRGNIGSLMERMAHALGMRVLVNDPPLQRLGTPGEFCSLEDLLAASDYVTCHVPLIREGPDRTVHLIGPDQLRAMHHEAVLINTSRGVVVDNVALEQALAEHRLGGAVLDVWEGEPTIRRSLLERVDLGTPHIAGYSADGKANGTAQVVNALRRHFGLPGDWIPWLVPPVSNVDPRASRSSGDTQPVFWGTGLVLACVRRSYDMRQDDARLRSGVALPDKEWGLHFDHLRRDYPVRREFPAYHIAADAMDPEVRGILSTLGFQIDPPTSAGNPPQ